MTNKEDRMVKITVQLPGQVIELTRERGFGDNPAYYANQIDDVLDGMRDSLRAMIAAEHGKQYGPERDGFGELRATK